MKNMLFIVALGLGLSQSVFAAQVITGVDDQGNACSVHVLQGELNNSDFAKVATNYSPKTIFALERMGSDRMYAARAFVSASTRLEMSVTYYPSQRTFIYAETTLNLRTGDVVFERIRECRLR